MSEQHKQLVARRFGIAAQTYGAFADVQIQAADRLLDQLPDQPKACRMLEVGCGTGILTEGLLKRFPEAEIDALDIAPEMITFAARRLGPYRRLRLITADVEHFQPTAPYDWMVSSSALHWLPERLAVFKRLHAMLNPGGLFCFSLMLNGTFSELQEARRETVPLKKPPVLLPDFAQVTAEVRAAGFIITRSVKTAQTVYYPSVHDFFRRIRRQGVTAGGPQAERLSRGELRRLEAAYTRRCAGPDGSIPVTYVVGLVSGFKSM